MEVEVHTIEITLPDGSKKSFPRGTTVREVAASIGQPTSVRRSCGSSLSAGLTR